MEQLIWLKKINNDIDNKTIDPDTYFKDVKKKKTKEITEQWLIDLHDIVEKKRKKAYVAGQNYLLKKLEFTYKIIKRELELVKKYNICKCVQYQDLKEGIIEDMRNYNLKLLSNRKEKDPNFKFHNVFENIKKEK